MDCLKVTRSNRGGDKLALSGYLYVRKKTRKNEIRWACSNSRSRNCKGALTTNILKGNPHNYREHTHPPDHEAVQATAIRMAMKAEARASGSTPGEILAKYKAQLSEQVGLKIGLTETIKRDLRRQRRLAAVSTFSSPPTTKTTTEAAAVPLVKMEKPAWNEYSEDNHQSFILPDPSPVAPSWIDEEKPGIQQPAPPPPDISTEEFNKWISIEDDVPVAYEKNGEAAATALETIMSSLKGKKVVTKEEEAIEQKEGKGEDNENTPSNDEMRACMHRLRIGLEQRGFTQMDKFSSMESDVLSFLRTMPVVQKDVRTQAMIQKDPGMDYEEVCQLTSNLPKLIWFLQSRRVLPHAMHCSCGRGMKFCPYTNKSGSSDGHCWRCKTCDRRKTVREGSWFQRCHVTLPDMVRIMYLWTTGASLKQLGSVCSVSVKSLIGFLRRLRSVCENHFRSHPVQLGGPGVVVEAGVTWYGKKPCSRHPDTGHRLLGLLDRKTGHSYFQVVPEDMSVVVEVVRTRIQLGSVVHKSQTLVDVESRGSAAMTVALDDHWSTIKAWLRMMRGTRIDCISAYLTEWMWKDRYCTSHGIGFDNLLKHISELVVTDS